MPQLDVVCIGNIKIDQFLSIHQAASHLRLNQETSELCLKYGEKIPVEEVTLALGGDAANVCVGLSRLGLKTSILAEIGNDEFSEIIKKSLKAEDINTEFLKQADNEKTSISVIISFQNERTILSQHVKRNHDFSFENIQTNWIYLTSLGVEWKSAYQKTSEFVKQKNIKLAFNPGTLQIDSGMDAIKNVLEMTHILFVNKEEAQTILNIKDKISNINAVLSALQKLGPKNVVVTDGENGSHAINEKGEIFTQGIIKTDVVEKTGAGDAYSSGFLAAYISNYLLQDAMKWGALNSTGTIQKVGAQNGLLYKAEMEQKLNAE